MFVTEREFSIVSSSEDQNLCRLKSLWYFEPLFGVKENLLSNAKKSSTLTWNEKACGLSEHKTRRGVTSEHRRTIPAAWLHWRHGQHVGLWRSCRTSGGLSPPEPSFEGVFECVCECVCIWGGLLSCLSVVPRPEFEIRSSSPGGLKSKPCFFICPLPLLFAFYFSCQMYLFSQVQYFLLLFSCFLLFKDSYFLWKTAERINWNERHHNLLMWKIVLLPQKL